MTVTVNIFKIAYVSTLAPLIYDNANEYLFYKLATPYTVVQCTRDDCMLRLLCNLPCGKRMKNTMVHILKNTRRLVSILSCY